MRTEGVFYVGPYSVELRPFEIGAPDLYEVQVELKASGLCAWDLALFEGDGGHPPHPFLHGHEGAGIVRAIGERVEGFQPGDKVAVMGNDAKLLGHMANVPQQYVARIPDGVTDYALWIAEPVACVCNGLEWCQIVPGDRIAVIGTGFMGLMFVQGLHHTLVQEIIAIDIDERRLALAGLFGADQIINPTTDEGQIAIEALRLDKLDVTVECAGNQAAFDLAYRLLRPAGRLNIFSAQRGDPRKVDLATWHGLGVQAYASSPTIARDFASIFRRSVGLMQRGVFDLAPLITHRASPDDAQQLFEIAKARSDGYIKGAIIW